jgi:hypothetical protein
MPLGKSWHEYNESLIERGRILMDIGFLRSSRREIKNMNKGKVRAPFEHSHTYIHSTETNAQITVNTAFQFSQLTCNVTSCYHDYYYYYLNLDFL